jgi:hypothetical protein
MLVHIIADYRFGEIAFAEVMQRLKFYPPDGEPILTPVPPFATLAAGFCIAQLGLNDSPQEPLSITTSHPEKMTNKRVLATLASVLLLHSYHMGERQYFLVKD